MADTVGQQLRILHSAFSPQTQKRFPQTRAQITWLALSGTLLSGLLAGTLSAQTTGKPDDFVSGRPSTASRELRDILHERDDLRRDLEALRQNIEQVRLRLAKLDQLSEVQQDLDLTLSQLRRTESDEDESRSRILEAKVEKIEQKLDQLQERVDCDNEIIEFGFRLIDAVQNDEKREAKEPTQEISEVLDEMKNGC